MTVPKITLFFIITLALAQADSNSSPVNNCGAGLTSCGPDCYTPAEGQYCCVKGVLTQMIHCPKSTTAFKTKVSTTSTLKSTPPTTRYTTKAATTVLTPATSAPSGSNICAKASYCSSATCACNGACYTPDMYCCEAGTTLRQAGQCSHTASTSNSAVSSSSSTKKSTPSTTTKSSSTTDGKKTTSSSISPAPTPSTTAAPIILPTPSPVSNPSNGQCTKCNAAQSCCAGTCYDSSIYGCSTSSNGTQQFLCPAPKATKQSSFWIGGIKHEGTSPFLGDSSYVVYRNVMAFGAKGDGVTDDTAAINSAITAYGRCGQGCDSTTTRPALVFFPSGKYLISSPIIQYYFTQLVGDATDLPVILAAPSFKGMALIDSDPYGSTGGNWYTNQNNFYRQVRNFVLDTTNVDASKATTCIHWQVAQATSLTNIVFKMSSASGTQHQGIWMENGSGGFMSDLVFYGGNFAMWVGNQQFTSRNISIYNAQTAIFMNWNWGWTFKTLYIENVNLGLDMSALGEKGKQQVGSVVLVDVKMVNTKTGIRTGTSGSPPTSCTLLVDNGYFANVNNVVVDSSGNSLVGGSGGTTYIPTWGQGHLYNAGNSGAAHRGFMSQANRPSALTDSKNGNNYYFERPRPQYENYAPSDFISVKSVGAVGDGKTDDTSAIQAALYKYAGCNIIYFPAGTYVLSNTVVVPPGSRIVGEAWSALMAKGDAFGDSTNPRPMIMAGRPGDVGVIEMSDLLFTASGAQPGAILVEWNIQDPLGAKGSAGMWDCHFRIGGAAGTNQQISQCPKFASPTPQCAGTFMMMHVTSTASAYLENVWLWTADHDLDAFGADMSGQISVFNGRGLLIESTAGVWLYGTASEHSVFYQYQLNNAVNVFMAMIQTETPYFQALPPAPTPWAQSSKYNDPDFTHCTADSPSCGMAWGIRYLDSSDVFLYGAGHYNFFRYYNQTCLTTEDCQDHMVDFQSDDATIHLYGLNTKASVNMITSAGGKIEAVAADHVNGFCSTIHFVRDSSS